VVFVAAVRVVCVVALAEPAAKPMVMTPATAAATSSFALSDLLFGCVFPRLRVLAIPSCLMANNRTGFGA